ncbi:UNVERIFIED_ORG: alkylation response protein AidB-like acyl-CoA dehydrogenase [Xanthobacter viscosus]|uniref:Uncharacterized protein n=1 Tax=Xanthobacter autotrophicus TaxID=280 RepID=A0A6C1KPE3_XANAU|nr:hypothetical protein [Xanthobacter autotrophicus]TLX41386.1 hypothetical protein FBQ73_18100 [Xanthobacter autotrophicus]
MSTKSASPVFDWADPFHLEVQLTEDERLVRDTSRDYAQDTYEGTHDIHALIIGRAITGIQAFA